MAQGNGLTRGDRNRNRKLALVREVVRRDRAVLAVDLGEDKQVAVVMDQECRVLARKVVKAKAHGLSGLIGWAAGGFPPSAWRDPLKGEESSGGRDTQEVRC